MKLRIIVAVTALVTAIAAAPANSARGLKTGTGGSEFLSADASVRGNWLGRAKRVNAQFVRIDMAWLSVAPRRPANPKSPADPAYDFTAYDRAVISVRARGLRPMITIYNPPSWATGSGCKPAHRARCKPNVKAFAKFGSALARRYSGRFGTLPRVKHFEAWNEPNLSLFLAPQWRKGKPVGALQYRRMLNSFRKNVKSVRRSNKVIAAGTAPFGERRGGDRMRPVEFWRHVFCLNRKLRSKCKGKARLDLLSHHAVNPRGGPGTKARHRDDAAVPELHKIKRVLRAAERRGRVPGKRHQLWVTEIWWQTNPPDKRNGVKPSKQAKYLVRTLYEVWRDGAKVAINYLIRDDALNGNPDTTWQSGLYFRSSKAKPAVRAFRFPFLARKRSRKKVVVWGRSPHSGKLRIQRKRGKRWRTVKKHRIGARKVFKHEVKRKGKTRWRAKVGKTKSPSSKTG